MKKKLLAVLLSMTMVAALLAGCGGKDEGADSGEAKTEASSEEDSGEKSGPEGKFVGFTVPSVGNDFMLALTDAVKAAVEETGAEMQVDSADGDVTKQIEQIENYITMGADLIVAFPINGESLTTVCQKAMDEGIPVFAFAMAIPDGATTTMLSAEESTMGAACADMTSEWIDATFADAKDGEVTVFMIASSYSPEAVDRSEAMKAIADNKKVNLIVEETPDWNSSDEARSLIENAFQVHPDIDVVIACNATTALGVDSYMSSSDCPVEDLSKFGIFTVDETTEVVSKITASKNNESVLRGTISMGAISDTVNDFMKGAMPILNGEEPIEMINGQATPITADTVEE